MTTATPPAPLAAPDQTAWRPGHRPPRALRPPVASGPGAPRALAGSTPESRAAEPSAAAGILRRAILAAELVHPFAALLGGLVVSVVAVVAGAVPFDALVLGASMALLLGGIGALNDLADAPRDARSGRPKPIPAGVVREPAARLVLAASIAGGLVLALVSGGPALLVLALAGLGIGFWYDLKANGTRLSWLPLALGVPVLPVFGWLGATGSLPPASAVLVPAAALAGAALAIAGSAADIERDAAAGKASLAVALGPTRAAVVVLGLQAAVACLAVGSGARLGATGDWLAIAGAAALVPVAGAVLGLVLARRGPAAREAAFEVQAVGLGVLVVAWVNVLSAAAAL